MDRFGDECALQMIASDEEFICPVYDTDLDLLCLDCSSSSEHEETSQISSLDLSHPTETGSDPQLDEFLQLCENSVEEGPSDSCSESAPWESSDRKCQEFHGDATFFEPDQTQKTDGALTLWFIDTFDPPVSYKKLRMMRRITIEQAFVLYFAEKGQLCDSAPIIFDKNNAEQIATEILARRVKIGRAGRKLKHDKPVRTRSQYMKLHGALMKANWKRIVSNDTSITQYLYLRP